MDRKCSGTIVESMREFSHKMALLEKATHECMTHKDLKACKSRLEILRLIETMTADYEEEILEGCQ